MCSLQYLSPRCVEEASMVESTEQARKRSSPRTLRNGRNGPPDEARIAGAVREILLAVCEDPDREGLCETPLRVARMYTELFAGLRQDPRVHLQKLFTQKYDEMVLVKDIHFESLCEHHLLPFMGEAHIA